LGQARRQHAERPGGIVGVVRKRVALEVDGGEGGARRRERREVVKTRQTVVVDLWAGRQRRRQGGGADARKTPPRRGRPSGKQGSKGALVRVGVAATTQTGHTRPRAGGADV